MNLYAKLQQRAAAGQPLRVGMIGAGKFGSMYLSQVPRTPGVHMVGIADLSPDRAKAALRNVGWKEEAFSATSLEQAAKQGNTAIIDNGMALITSPHVDIIIDATGNPAIGIAHVLACCEHKKHIVMVNVEADALAGPLALQRHPGHRCHEREYHRIAWPCAAAHQVGDEHEQHQRQGCLCCGKGLQRKARQHAGQQRLRERLRNAVHQALEPSGRATQHDQRAAQIGRAHV